MILTATCVPNHRTDPDPGSWIVVEDDQFMQDFAGKPVRLEFKGPQLGHVTRFVREGLSLVVDLLIYPEYESFVRARMRDGTIQTIGYGFQAYRDDGWSRVSRARPNEMALVRSSGLEKVIPFTFYASKL